MAHDPADPRARFYLALAKAQAGDVAAALADWVKLEAEAPAEAPWRPAVTEQIARAAGQLGLDAAALPGRAALPPDSAATDRPPGPDESDVAAAADMTPEELEILKSTSTFAPPEVAPAATLS